MDKISRVVITFLAFLTFCFLLTHTSIPILRLFHVDGKFEKGRQKESYYAMSIMLIRYITG